MLSSKLRKLFTLLKMKKDMKIQARSKKLLKKRRYHLPDIVWNIIFDYSSPFDVVRWSRVSRQLRRVAMERARTTIYLDVLRIHLNDILPVGVITDGDFFRHSVSQLMAHSERRSILLAVHSQWTVKDALKLVGAIQYYGRHAHTVTLDASIAELIVASQCTADLSHWFAFQTANYGPDSSFTIKNTYVRADWMQEEQFGLFTQKLKHDDSMIKWNPKTQRIPLGPLFPKAKEISFRCSIPQLYRMRRLHVYRSPPTYIFSTEVLQMFRLSIIGGRSMAPTTLRLRRFNDWIEADRLGNKMCIQFC